MHLHHAIAALLLLGACTSPDVSAEVGAFSESVTAVSQQYRGALGIGSGTVRAGQVEALVADRGALVGLSVGCDELGSGDREASATDCNLDDGGLTLPENSVARAELQLRLLAEYFTALDVLARSKGPADIQNATAAALASVGALDNALPKPGLGAFAGTLQERRTGIESAAGFLAEQYKLGKLRRVVRAADPAVSRLVLALEDAAVANGIDPAGTEYERLRQRQVEMDEARLGGDDAAYRAAIQAFMAEYDRFADYQKTGLIPRLNLIRDAHRVLAARLSGPATVAEISALLDRLNTLKSGFD